MELAGFDIVPDHPLLAGLAADNGIAPQDHSSLLEPAGEIEIRSIAIHPCLAPKLAFRVIDRDADPGKIRRREVFLDDLPLQDSLNTVRSSFIISPEYIPLSEPEIELVFRVNGSCP